MTRPFEPVAILTNVVIASTNSRYQKRLSNKIAKLEETLRSIRMVERAKVVLMKARNIEEPEAYAYLRDQAMRKRTSVGSIASVIVESGNILLGSRDEF
jgi:AmiR/NasT family two-component response regulator